MLAVDKCAVGKLIIFRGCGLEHLQRQFQDFVVVVVGGASVKHFEQNYRERERERDRQTDRQTDR